MSRSEKRALCTSLVQGARQSRCYPTFRVLWSARGPSLSFICAVCRRQPAKMAGLPLERVAPCLTHFTCTGHNFAQSAPIEVNFFPPSSLGAGQLTGVKHGVVWHVYRFLRLKMAPAPLLRRYRALKCTSTVSPTPGPLAQPRHHRAPRSTCFHVQ